MAPPPEKLRKAPAEVMNKADSLGLSDQIDADLGRLGKRTDVFPAAADVPKTPAETTSEQVRKSKMVTEWLKIDSDAKPLETKMNQFHKIDRDDYVLFRMLSDAAVNGKLPSFRPEDVLVNGKPDMWKMRAKMVEDDDEKGYIAKAFGFYWSGSKWAVILQNGDDTDISETGGFVNTFKNSIFLELQKQGPPTDDDSPLSEADRNGLVKNIDSFSHEYDLLNNDKESGLSEEDKKLDIFLGDADHKKNGDTKTVFQILESTQNEWITSAPLVEIFDRHFMTDAGSYKFRLVKRQGKAYLYALRCTNEQALPRLRILEIGTLKDELDDKGKPKKEIIFSDGGFFNNASWNHCEKYETDVHAQAKLAELIEDLPKESLERDRISVLANGLITRDVADQICGKLLANEKKDLRYSFSHEDDLQAKLKELLTRKLISSPYDVIGEQQRGNIAAERAKHLVEIVRFEIEKYDGGVFNNPDLVSDEERAQLEIDFEFDAAEGVRISLKGRATALWEKAKGVRDKAVSKGSDVLDDFSGIKEKVQGNFLLASVFENDEELKDAVSGKDPIGHFLLAILGIGPGKKAVSKFSEKHPQLAGFIDSMKRSISEMTGGFIELYEHIDKPKLTLMQSAGKKFEKDLKLGESFKTDRELFVSKIVFGDDLNLTINGSVQSFEGGKAYSSLRIPAGTVLSKDTVVFHNSQFAKQTAVGISPVTGTSSTFSKPS